MRFCIAAVLAAFLWGTSMNTNAQTSLPPAIQAVGETVVLTLHAEGAQIYECKADETGKLAWVLREPTATLILDGKTVGRHYAGPNWELSDGSAIVGKAVATAPGATGKDIPLVKLEVISARGSGQLTGITTVQRINTEGGKADAPCVKAGAYFSAPYAADYVFLKKA
ncbi:MAG: DUF3455 domain-containing protein [Xanthobacteraceae bacterium]|nr:DUF3455 domain-containing protein [Xanthobacteraceae bacterium]